MSVSVSGRLESCSALKPSRNHIIFGKIEPEIVPIRERLELIGVSIARAGRCLQEHIKDGGDRLVKGLDEWLKKNGEVRRQKTREGTRLDVRRSIRETRGQFVHDTSGS